MRPMCRRRVPDLPLVSRTGLSLAGGAARRVRPVHLANGIRAMTNTVERRRGERIVFERGIPAHMMAIDGTWRRDCIMEDVSETGAKLTVEGSVEGLHLKELFLLLSSTRLSYCRSKSPCAKRDQA